MTTDVVTPDNFDRVYPKDAREAYWRLAKRSLVDIFGLTDIEADSTIDRYRESLVSSSDAAQIYLYHISPLHVAADLAGASEVSEEQYRSFRDLAGSHEPAQRGWPSDRS